MIKEKGLIIELSSSLSPKTVLELPLLAGSSDSELFHHLKNSERFEDNRETRYDEAELYKTTTHPSEINYVNHFIIATSRRASTVTVPAVEIFVVIPSSTFFESKYIKVQASSKECLVDGSI